jgi:hypothetical protein
MFGLCGSGSVSAGYMVGAQYCLVGSGDDWTSGKLTFTRTYTPLTQKSTGIGVAAAVQGLVSNARKGSDFGGPFGNVGIGYGKRWVFAGDIALGRADDGYPVYTVAAGAGIGAKMEVHYGLTYTEVGQFDLANLPIPFNPWRLLNELSGRD